MSGATSCISGIIMAPDAVYRRYRIRSTWGKVHAFITVNVAVLARSRQFIWCISSGHPTIDSDRFERAPVDQRLDLTF